MSWPQTWGFLVDPKDWIGKTVEMVEVLAMEFGCTHNESVALRFTDGTRGWILGRNSKGVGPSPSESALSKSLIVTPEEFGQYQAHRLALHQSRVADERRRKLGELKRLQEELGKET